MKLGLTLAGGGVKGAAHIGVLKYIEENNIKIDYISGTSSGSIVATLYAAGYNSNEIYQIFKKYCSQINYISISNVLKLIFGLIFKKKILIQGLNNGEKIEKIINELCNKKEITNINQIKLPLIIPSVDLHNGKTYIFTSSKLRSTYNDNTEYVNNINIGTAVRASCSYPGVFSPCKYKNTELIDGGIRENVPWRETKLMGADKVISVVFKEDLESDSYINIIEVVSRALGILSHELSNYELFGADDLIKIKTSKISLLDTTKIEYLYKLGYKEASKQLPKILKKY